MVIILFRLFVDLITFVNVQCINYKDSMNPYYCRHKKQFVSVPPINIFDFNYKHCYFTLKPKNLNRPILRILAM